MLYCWVYSVFVSRHSWSVVTDSYLDNISVWLVKVVWPLHRAELGAGEDGGDPRGEGGQGGEQGQYLRWDHVQCLMLVSLLWGVSSWSLHTETLSVALTWQVSDTTQYWWPGVETAERMPQSEDPPAVITPTQNIETPPPNTLLLCENIEGDILIIDNILWSL